MDCKPQVLTRDIGGALEAVVGTSLGLDCIPLYVSAKFGVSSLETLGIVPMTKEFVNQIDAANLWDLDAQIDISMEALRCPPDDADVTTLSGGEKRRVALCQLLLDAPDMLLLDEPTAGMARADTENTISLLKEIRTKRGITMAIIEHDMNVVFSLAERITVLAQGTPLVEDIPENIKGHPKVREAYLGEAQV